MENKKKQTTKTGTIIIKVTPEHKKLIFKQAHLRGISMASLCISSVLEKLNPKEVLTQS